MTPARSPGRHLAPARGAGSASHHRAPPSRSVLGLLAAGLLLVLSLVLVVAPVALAEEEDGASVSDGSTDTGATDTGATDTGGSSGLDGTGALAGDYGPGGYADHMGTGGSPPPGESTSGPSAGGGPTPTQHDGIPPAPMGNPFGTPVDPLGGQLPGSFPSNPGLSLGGPGGNTGSFGHHESDE